jgi:hypothetical protein
VFILVALNLALERIIHLIDRGVEFRRASLGAHQNAVITNNRHLHAMDIPLVAPHFFHVLDRHLSDPVEIPVET